jgi:hypothetical protein
MKAFVWTCLVILTAGSAVLEAQSNETSSALIQASAGDVTDNRTTGAFNSECTVELKFTGDAAADAGTVRQVRLAEAVDDLGRDLIPKKTDASPVQPFSFNQGGDVLKYDVKLRNPSRKASTIKTLRGEVELFNPTEANGGLLTIKEVLKHPAEPSPDPVLAKYNVQLIYLTKDAYEAKKKELEAQSNGTGQKIGEAFGDLFKGMLGGMISDSKNSIQLYVHDPDNRIVSLKFADGNGQPLESRESWSSNDFRSTGFDTPPPADTELIIQLATPESLKSYPFTVENIPLP